MAGSWLLFETLVRNDVLSDVGNGRSVPVVLVPVVAPIRCMYIVCVQFGVCVCVLVLCMCIWLVQHAQGKQTVFSSGIDSL